MKIEYGVLLVVAVALLLGGCASNLSGESFSREEARKAQKVRFAVVEHVRDVIIEGTKTPVGAAAGAVVGSIAGSTLGDGKGSKIGAVLGSVVGGVAGAATEEAVTKRQGVEVTVKMDNGEIFAIVQQATKNETFAVGDKVRVLSRRGVMRVTH